MKELEVVGRKSLALFIDSDPHGLWVMWIHKDTVPAKTNVAKTINAAVGTIIPMHCGVCLNLNGCHFLKSKMPEFPPHPNCHCHLENIPKPIPGITAISDCDIKKFTGYIFDPKKNKGKNALFQAWGYSIIDSEWLKKEFIKQAQEKYALGDYELGNLDVFGQRIDIEITLPRRDGKPSVTFITGWMVYPYGNILLTTPYGGEK